MSDEPRKNEGKTLRGRPFQRGNAGRPPGARNKATRAAEALLDGEAAALTRKAIHLALEGDTTALRLCMERICPPRRDRCITFDLPPVETAGDATKVVGGLLAAVACGQITPGEAVEIGRLLEGFVKAVEATEFEARLAALEGERKT